MDNTMDFKMGDTVRYSRTKFNSFSGDIVERYRSGFLYREWIEEDKLWLKILMKTGKLGELELWEIGQISKYFICRMVLTEKTIHHEDWNFLENE